MEKSDAKRIRGNDVEKGDLFTIEETVISYTNDERRQRGIRPLEVSPALNFIARRHSAHMCQTRTFENESEKFPVGWRDLPSRLKKVGLMSGAENSGFRTITPDSQKWAKDIVAGCIADPISKKNLLNEKYLYVGVGICFCGNRLGYITQVFAPDSGSLTAGKTE